ncbi:dihydroxyacetone kinase phosphoryl donor subunit DhaM [soil metagenome]
MGPVAGKVGLVFVSHSSKIAEGLVDLASQMAPNTAFAAAGGTDEGGIGTSFDKVSAAIPAVDSGPGVVVLCDLGSAILTAETALDFLDDDRRERVRIVDAPLIEGAVAASVAAETGGSLDEVVAAAEAARRGPVIELPATSAAPAAPPAAESVAPLTRRVQIVNSDGLHARPAAEFVKLANTFPVKISINGRDSKSLLGIMSLGLVKGATATLKAEDQSGRVALDALADLIESGFGEA